MKTLSRVLVATMLAQILLVQIPKKALAAGEEELLFMEVPTVITASKSSESVTKAPSVVTVWTADDIQKMGVRSLKELFQRTSGFFATRQYGQAVFGSHGLIADTNTAFLFLIDGHSINSIGMDGPSNYWYLPALDKVKQVEIVRGPGSTLWGTDAAMATINIITKDGSDINGLQTSVSAASDDGTHTFDVLYGKNYGENKSAMVSFTLANENGFPYGKSATTYPSGFTWTLPAGTPAGTQPVDHVAPLDEMPASYEFHAKVKMDELTISAHSSEVMNTDLWQRNTDPGNQYFQRRITNYVEVADDAKISDNLSLTTKAFADSLVTDDHMFNLITSPSKTNVDEESLTKEQKIGLDMMFTQDFKDVDNLKYGVRGVITSLDPMITYNGLNFNSLPGNSTNNGGLALIALPSDYDKDFAAFVENDWKATDKLDIILGLRADNDNLLENKTAYLPRGSAIYSFDKSSTLKYCYNTGYVRPEAGTGFLGQTPEKYLDPSQGTGVLPLGGNYDQVGANKAEEVYTNDLQYLYNSKTFEGSIDFYQTVMKNYFNYSGALTPAGTITSDGLPDRLATVNANNITTVGVEIDAKKKFNKFDIYGNVSQIFSAQVNSFVWQIGSYTTTLQGGSLYDNNLNVCAFPYTTFNVGTDIDLSKDICLNVHVNGWGNGYMVKVPASNSASTNGTYETIPVSSIVDVNIVFKNLCGSKALTAAVFAKNLFNNETAEVPLVDAGGFYYAEGISVGAKVTYKFSAGM